MRNQNADEFRALLTDPSYPRWIENHEIDLHIHSDCSDGSDSVEDLVEKIHRTKLQIFSLTDHDNVEGVKRILNGLKSSIEEKDSLLFIPGIEFSCKLSQEEAKANGLDLHDREGKIRKCEFHILGYEMDLKNPDFLEAIRVNRTARVEKVKERIPFLRENGYPELTEADVDTIINENFNPGKPHIVGLMEKKGLINPDQGFQDPGKASRQDIFDLLEKHHSHQVVLTPEQAVNSIVKAGGIAVLAHGVKGSGSDNFTKDETERRVRYLMQFGLEGLECYYSPYEKNGYLNGFTMEQQNLMIQLADRYGLYKTVGSDYHGDNKKTVELGRKERMREDGERNGHGTTA